MSSSDRTGAAGKAVAADPGAAPPPAGDDGRDGAAQADPWFTPGPKHAAPTTPGADDVDDLPFTESGAADGSADWFLPTGRAALMPDSMTLSWEDGSAARPDRAQQLAVGTPPWGPEPTVAAATAGVPPPWENGPWPGPGERRMARQPRPVAASGEPATTGGPPAGWRARRGRIALAAGGGVAVLVVLIVVIVAVTSGGPASGCGTYPAAVRRAYATAMTDLRGHPQPSVQAAALGQAASLANASAAAAGQIGVRTALFTMASDLDQAHADVVAHRALSPDLLQRLTADGTALPASCSS